MNLRVLVGGYAVVDQVYESGCIDVCSAMAAEDTVSHARRQFHSRQVLDFDCVSLRFGTEFCSA